MVTDTNLIANKFNDFFINVGQSLADKIPPRSKSYQHYLSKSPCNSFVVAPTSPEEIIQLGRTMHITHSSGLDDIDPCIANPYLDLLALPLAAIFNASFMTGIIPSALKMAKIIPIFKQGNRAEASNYRPISILSYFAKLLEKLMYVRLYNYICQNNFLYPLQHGFQSGHSTAMSLIDLQDKISLAIDNNEFSLI